MVIKEESHRKLLLAGHLRNLALDGSLLVLPPAMQMTTSETMPPSTVSVALAFKLLEQDLEKLKGVLVSFVPGLIYLVLAEGARSDLAVRGIARSEGGLGRLAVVVNLGAPKCPNGRLVGLLAKSAR